MVALALLDGIIGSATSFLGGKFTSVTSAVGNKFESATSVAGEKVSKITSVIGDKGSTLASVAGDRASSLASKASSAAQDITSKAASAVKSLSTEASATISSIKQTASTLTKTSNDSSAIEILATITSPPATTLATSTSSPSISQSASPNIVGSTPLEVNSSPNGPRVAVAGIIVISIVGFIALVSVLFLVCRYCTPIRQRYDGWKESKRDARTYREGIDGLGIPADKLSLDGAPKPSFGGQRFYEMEGAASNNRVSGVRSTGLGLGHRLSLLRQHSPFQSANHGTEPPIGVAVAYRGNRDLPPLPR